MRQFREGHDVGGLVGGLAGAAIVIVVQNMVLFLGLPIQVQIMLKGAIIVLAAIVYVKSAAH